MPRALPVLAVVAIVCAAQTPLAFDVASVKLTDQSGRQGVHGGPGTADPGRVSYHQVLRWLLMRAYRLRNDQIAGPGWINTDWFDIVANVPPNTSEDQVNLMLQNLLVERFGIASHREMRDVPTYFLTLAKDGPKLAPTVYPGAMPGDAGSFTGGSLTLDKSGFPVLPPNAAIQTSLSWVQNHTMRSTFRSFPMVRLAADLEGAVPDLIDYDPVFGRSPARVLDKTGLTGRYDFTLEYAGEGTEGNGPSIFAAVEKQLGLKIEKTKAPLDVMVIDRINRTPAGN